MWRCLLWFVHGCLLCRLWCGTMDSWLLIPRLRFLLLVFVVFWFLVPYSWLLINESGLTHGSWSLICDDARFGYVVHGSLVCRLLYGTIAKLAQCIPDSFSLHSWLTTFKTRFFSCLVPFSLLIPDSWSMIPDSRPLLPAPWFVTMLVLVKQCMGLILLQKLAQWISDPSSPIPRARCLVHVFLSQRCWWMTCDRACFGWCTGVWPWPSLAVVSGLAPLRVRSTRYVQHAGQPGGAKDRLQRLW